MQRDRHDLWGGGILAAVGLAVAVYSLGHYDFGSLRRMGPGFFPTVLGGVLAVLGVMVAVPAARRAGEARPLSAPEFATVIAAIVLFGLLLDRLGIIVTTALTVLVATIPAPRSGIGWRLLLAAVLTALTWAVFGLGLDMPLPAWPWSR